MVHMHRISLQNTIQGSGHNFYNTMKKIFILLFLFLATSVYAAPPTRISTYTPNTVISSTEVTGNEDAIFNYLQAGVDTYFDGSIVNSDVNTSANIQSDKLNLTAIGQAMAVTASGSFTNNGTTTLNGSSAFGAVTTGVVSAVNVTGGVLDGVQIGYNTPANYLVGTNVTATNLTATSLRATTFNLGTTNQGDILYDNGTSLVRLTPGTSGYYLKTNGTGANPAWAVGNLSNVIFSFGLGGSDFNSTGYGVVSGSSINPAPDTFVKLMWGAVGSTERTILSSKYKKIAGQGTITVYARLWGESGGNTYTLKVDIGGQSNSTTSTSATPAWVTFNVDVSSLTAGTVYDVSIIMSSSDGADKALMDSIIGFAG